MSVQDASTITGNAAIVWRAYEAFNAADLNALTELFDGREHFYDLHAWDEFWS